MSIEVMTRVWKHSTQKGGALLLLLAIADFADDDGFAWPSVATLAKKARMTERNARYALRALETAGEIEVTPGGGQHGTSGYVVKPGANIAGGQILPGAKQRKGGGKMRQEGGAHFAPNPSLRTTIEPSLEEGANDAPAPNDAAPPPPKPCQSKPKTTLAPAPHSPPPVAWAPFYDAVSETLGGLRVVNAKTGAPLAWVGELAGLAGKHVNGEGPAGAAALWREFTASGDWRYAGKKPADWPAAFGKWIGQRQPAQVLAFARAPVIRVDPNWVEGDPVPF